MTNVEMRIAKQLLHKAIVDIILNFEPNDEELDELWNCVKTLAEAELNA
jgi:hypothetical protein